MNKVYEISLFPANGVASAIGDDEEDYLPDLDDVSHTEVVEDEEEVELPDIPPTQAAAPTVTNKVKAWCRC